jgi:hypothetical protein
VEEGTLVEGGEKGWGWGEREKDGEIGGGGRGGRGQKSSLIGDNEMTHAPVCCAISVLAAGRKARGTKRNFSFLLTSREY